MPSPERPQSASFFSETRQEPIVILADIDRQLEAVDAIENPIERTYKREQLLEQRDELEADIEASVSSSE